VLAAVERTASDWGQDILKPMTQADMDASRVHAGVLRAVRAACPVWLSGEIEDLAQTATLKVLERFRNHEKATEGLAMSYLWRTAHSVVVDEIRRRGRRPEVPVDERFIRCTAAGEKEGPEAVAAMSRLSGALHACLQGLALARRRAVALHLLGYSIVETAELCGWARKRAENLVYRGMSDLRACLRSKGYDHE